MKLLDSTWTKLKTGRMWIFNSHNLGLWVFIPWSGGRVLGFEWRYICSNKTNNRIEFSNDKRNEIQPFKRYMNLDSTFKPFLQVKTSNQWLLQKWQYFHSGLLPDQTKDFPFTALLVPMITDLRNSDLPISPKSTGFNGPEPRGSTWAGPSMRRPHFLGHVKINTGPAYLG